MLNGPASYNKNNSIKSEKYTKCPGAQIKRKENCEECCSCTPAQKRDQSSKCNCICKCFGYFAYPDWEFDFDNLPTHFEEGSIKILYRDKIRCFYGTVKQAKQDNYC